MPYPMPREPSTSCAAKPAMATPLSAARCEHGTCELRPVSTGRRAQGFGSPCTGIRVAARVTRNRRVQEEARRLGAGQHRLGSD
eukprot:5624198-Prymnesium_polylepis.1